jgi:FKBP-type peptidyl-prolyl cis-trans isomerase FkpA
MGDVTVEELSPGAGPAAKAGDVLSVHYTGWLEDGREFDSSRGRGPFELTLGRGEVIRGWERGLEGMRAGGRRRLTIPPELAYGSRGFAGLIPPQATLVFEVELLAIR